MQIECGKELWSVHLKLNCNLRQKLLFQKSGLRKIFKQILKLKKKSEKKILKNILHVLKGWPSLVVVVIFAP